MHNSFITGQDYQEIPDWTVNKHVKAGKCKPGQGRICQWRMLIDNVVEAGLLVTTQLMTTWGRYSALLLILFRTTWTCGHKKYFIVYKWFDATGDHDELCLWDMGYVINVQNCQWCYKIYFVSRFSQIIDIFSCKVYMQFSIWRYFIKGISVFFILQATQKNLKKFFEFLFIFKSTILIISVIIRSTHTNIILYGAVGLILRQSFQIFLS